mmetsp:Transcript_24451/g.47636  ORF Transcript_24451/g.47636 Transcript_24451/m.47636 type:complete len:364 (+) Transcript_24451:144-1235(+)
MEQRLTWLPYAAAAGLLSILAAVGGTLPLLLRDEAIGPMGPGLGRRRYFRSLGACFSGGLMLSAAFVHLLPEASRALDCGVEEQVEVGAMGGEDVAAEGDAGHVDLARRGLHSDDSEAGFPFAMLLCSAGLLGTMLVESLAHGAHGAHGGEHKRKGRDSPPDDGDACCTKLCPRRASPAPSDSEAGRALDGWHAEEDQEQLLLLRAHESADALTAIVTFFAFAFHSVMEGLALGVSGEIFEMFIAISAHKVFAAFALGTSLTRATRADGTPFSNAQLGFSVALFAALTPAGIVIGRLCVQEVSGGPLQSALTAVAAGTFLYMSLIEIIAKELAENERASAPKVHKVVVILLGYGLMALLGIWV